MNTKLVAQSHEHSGYMKKQRILRDIHRQMRCTISI